MNISADGVDAPWGFAFLVNVICRSANPFGLDDLFGFFNYKPAFAWIFSVATSLIKTGSGKSQWASWLIEFTGEQSGHIIASHIKLNNKITKNK